MENIFTAFLNTFSDPYKRSAGMIQTWLNGAKPEVAFILPPFLKELAG